VDRDDPDAAATAAAAAASPATPTATSVSAASTSTTSSATPLHRPQSARTTARSRQEEDPAEALLGRRYPPSPFETSGPRDQAEPGAGRGQTLRLPGPACRGAAVDAARLGRGAISRSAARSVGSAVPTRRAGRCDRPALEAWRNQAARLPSALSVGRR
jgi:hypothetical protein